MNTRILTISFAVFWLTILAGLLTGEWWMPAPLKAKIDNQDSPTLTAIPLVMGGWCLYRCFFSGKAAAPKSQITDEMRRKIRGITGTDPKITDPQFNFDDADTPPTK